MLEKQRLNYNNKIDMEIDFKIIVKEHKEKISQKYRSMTAREDREVNPIQRLIPEERMIFNLYRAFGGRCMVTGLPITLDWFLDIGVDRLFDNSDYTVDTIVLMLFILNRAKDMNSIKNNIFKNKKRFKEFMDEHKDNNIYGFDYNDNININVIIYLRFFFKNLIIQHHQRFPNGSTIHIIN